MELVRRERESTVLYSTFQTVPLRLTSNDKDYQVEIRFKVQAETTPVIRKSDSCHKLAILTGFRRIFKCTGVVLSQHFLRTEN